MGLLATLGIAATETSYTIEFSTGTNTQNQLANTTQASTFVSFGADYLTATPVTAHTNAFGNTADGIRVGSSSNPGNITLALSDAGKVIPTKIEVTCKAGKSGNTIAYNEGTAQSPATTETTLTFAVNVTEPIESLKFNTSKRIGITKIQVYYDGGDGTTLEKVATPTISPNGGEVAAGSNITISCTTADASITYSWDGGEKTEIVAPATVVAPSVNGQYTLTAFATADGYTQSEAATATYTVIGGEEPPAETTATFDFTTQTYGMTVYSSGTDFNANPCTISSGDVSLTLNDANNRLWKATNGVELRISKNCTLSFAVPAGSNITKIEFTGTAGATLVLASGQPGTYDSSDTHAWTGSANSVKFVANQSSGTKNLTTITITYTSITAPTPAVPVVMNGSVELADNGEYTLTQGTVLSISCQDATSISIVGTDVSAGAVYSTMLTETPFTWTPPVGEDIYTIKGVNATGEGTALTIDLTVNAQQDEPSSELRGQFNSFGHCDKNGAYDASNPWSAHSAYATYTNATGWVAQHCQVFIGGGSEDDPGQPQLGSIAPDVATAGLVLNGAGGGDGDGTVTSPVIPGMSTFTFNYAFPYKNDNNYDFTVTFTEAETTPSSVHSRAAGDVILTQNFQGSVDGTNIKIQTPYSASIAVNTPKRLRVTIADNATSAANGVRVALWNVDWSDDTSALTAIEAEDAAATPVYYNLQGQQVPNPTSGLYIRVSRRTATKVLLP